MAADDASVFDEMTDEAWDHLTGVPVTSSILRALHSRAKQKTLAKPVREFDTLSTMAQQNPSASTKKPIASSAKPPRPKKAPQRKQIKQQQQPQQPKNAVKVVTGATVCIPDRYSRVCVENEDGEEIEY